MAEYTAKKAQRGSPESSLEEADKVIVFVELGLDMRHAFPLIIFSPSWLSNLPDWLIAPVLSAFDQLNACMTAAAAKLKETPCDEIRLAFNACLKRGSRISCHDLKNQLEECTAKHLGKLD
jgi:hypothetical protein